MKAIVCEKYGSPDVLQLMDAPKPSPGDNETLVKVHATTVNRTDCAMLRAKPFFSRLITGMFKPKRKILGTDFAGEIEAVGKNVTKYKEGEKVFGFDEDFSDHFSGSHAQYMTIPEDSALATMPENITYEQAAASIEGAHYAYNFVNKVKLEGGDKILVNGATGAIGSAAVQLLKHFKAEITAVCGAENMELVRSLGASRVIDYTSEDFTKDDQQYDFVFDAVGKSSFSKCKPLLKPGGAYISSELGFMWQNLFFALVTPIIGNKKVIFPLPVNCKESIRLVKQLIEEGQFNSLIDRKYSLEQIVEAYKYVEKGEKIGNVVITMNHVG